MLRSSFMAYAVILLGMQLGPVEAAEQPAGQPLNRDGMQLMAVYLQSVEMEPSMPGQEGAKTDIHLEVDIHALQKNPNGFPEDAWIPYLQVSYQLKRKGSNWTSMGPMMPMAASDGPHYGSNIKLDGPGAYEMVLHIAPPDGMAAMRHVDKETGVAPWFKPFDYTGGFNFFGTGKKGGY